jgi:hypothetical protein
MSNKYLLCRPVGGFNDSLCHILKCYNYCKKYNRNLLIDTKYSHFINDSFDKYFTFINSNNIIYNSDTIKQIIETDIITVYPTEINKNDLYKYNFYYNRENNNIFYTFNNINISINLDTDYEEDLIFCIYNQGGNGFEVIKLLYLNDWVIDYIELQYKKILKPYLSIHIRNTDYKSNYIELYEEKIDLINENINVFLATDSLEVIDFFKSKKSNIYSFIRNIKNDNKPLHKTKNENIVIDMLCDLILLSLSDTFIHPKKYHGFTNLIISLFNNKNFVHIFTKNRFNK